MYDYPFVNPCQLLPITFLSFLSSEIISRFFSITFLGTEARLTNLEFPRSSFLSFLKIKATIAFLHNMIYDMIFSTLELRGSSDPNRKEHYEKRICLFICTPELSYLPEEPDLVTYHQWLRYTTTLTVPGSVHWHWKIHVILLVFQDEYSTL